MELIIVCEELKRKGKIWEPQNGWAAHTIIDWVITVVFKYGSKMVEESEWISCIDRVFELCERTCFSV